MVKTLEKKLYLKINSSSQKSPEWDTLKLVDVIWGLHFQIFNVVYVHLIIYKATFSSQLFILWQST